MTEEIRSRKCQDKEGNVWDCHDSYDKAFDAANANPQRGELRLAPEECGECGGWRVKSTRFDRPSLLDATGRNTVCRWCRSSSQRLKRTYATQTEADEMARLREKNGAPRLRSYRCEWTTGFHLTKAEEK